MQTGSLQLAHDWHFNELHICQITRTVSEMLLSIFDLCALTSCHFFCVIVDAGCATSDQIPL